MLDSLTSNRRNKRNAVLIIYTIDGKLIVDKEPNTEAGLLTSKRYKRVYGLTDPLPVMKHRRGSTGRQPVTLGGRRGWVKCGQENLYRDDNENRSRLLDEQRRFNESLLHVWNNGMVRNAESVSEDSMPWIDKFLPPLTWTGIASLAFALAIAGIRSVS